MKVPMEWLASYADAGLAPAQLAEKLALTGTEVDRVLAHGTPGEPDKFVVGKVVSAEQHPDADRLRVCMVDIGQPELNQIVCGAPNVAAGQTVAVALPGAVMPGGMKLKKAKLRGQVSNGMICSERELELGQEHDGILVLPDDAGNAGDPLSNVFVIKDAVLDLEITPNRPDCLCVYGVAREVHAATGAALAPEPWLEDPGTFEPAIDGIQITVEDPAICPRFTARVFENVTIGPSPLWLKERLMAAGQRPISNVVDITNYAMLVAGQPLHAFDLDRIAGGTLNVRRAKPGEQVTTLDDQVRTLDEQMVLIEDAEGPTSIAGVMGGARSEVHAGTTRVLMEAATWIGHNIQRTGVKLNLRSEASSRFEKGLAPEQTLMSLAVSSILMIELCGATLVPGTIDVGGAGPEPQTIRLRTARVESLLGMAVDVERQAEILRALGFEVEDADDGLDVTVPGLRRLDVTREADLIEEVARIHGVDQLPATLPMLHQAGVLSAPQRARRRAEDALVGAGLYEIVGWSFTGPELVDKLRLEPGDPRRRAVTLRNPMSAEQSRLRTTLLGSLLDAAAHNGARGMPDTKLWEYGAVYIAEPAAAEGGSKLPQESQVLGGLLKGPARVPTWRDPRPPEVDVFAAKAALDTVFDALRIDWSVAPAEAGEHPFLHPSRAANVIVGGEPLGWFGELHPLVAQTWDLEGRIAVFEFDLGRAAGFAPDSIGYTDMTSFPSVRQDIAVILSDAVAAAEVVSVVRAAGGALLADANVFDVYAGPQVGEGNRSLAIRLEFRAADRTLTDEEVAARRERITGALATQLGGELRG